MAEQTIKITFPDGSVREYPAGITPYEVAGSISHGLQRNALSASFNGQTVELSTPLTRDGELRFYTWDDDEGKRAFWHSSAHIMAQAIKKHYPNAKLTIGPPIENGFYYDIDFGDETFTEKDFPKIEKTFMEIARGKHPFRMREVSKQAALDFYRKENNPYKIELIEGLNDGEITFCDHDDFTDLCRGGHIPHTGLVKAFKIMNAAGAYWRGDEKNKQLTRVYGISFPKKKMLDEYLQMLEEAKKRDHRKLGRELEIFAFSDKVGQGLPLWLPRGAKLRELLENFLKKAQQKAGYQQVITPHIGHKNLYVTSGHYEKYGQDSFQPIRTPREDEEFLLKPMNCPHHIEIYKTRQWSYKELPVRYAEFGTVYRYEQSGELHGLTRVRGFTQDDAHIFCTPEQLKDEFKGVIDLVLYVFGSLGFDNFEAQISLRDPNDKEKYIGSEENWQRAEQAIIEAAEEKGLKTKMELGEAAFYGPKLDFMVRDVLGRKWQLGTIQVDYNLPERFGLEYKGPDNQMHRPVMIHRAPFGSLERFVAILLEHTGGDLPLWLAPEQAIILPISEKYLDFAENVLNLLAEKGIRATVDRRDERVGKKIRDAELMKIPYMLIVGEKERETGTVSVRRRKKGDMGSMKVEELARLLKEEEQEATRKFNQ